MIGRTIRAKRFRGRLKYVLDKKGAVNLFARNIGSGQTIDRFTLEMESCAEESRCKEPVYHLILSWSPKDEVTADQMRDVGVRVIRKLGLEEHQAVAVQHTDEEHPHLHIIVNRVHPRHGKMDAKGKPIHVWLGWKDGERIQSELRDIEQEYGWIEVPGRLALREGRWDFRKDV